MVHEGHPASDTNAGSPIVHIVFTSDLPESRRHPERWFNWQTREPERLNRIEIVRDSDEAGKILRLCADAGCRARVHFSGRPNPLVSMVIESGQWSMLAEIAYHAYVAELEEILEQPDHSLEQWWQTEFEDKHQETLLCEESSNAWRAHFEKAVWTEYERWCATSNPALRSVFAIKRKLAYSEFDCQAKPSLSYVRHKRCPAVSFTVYREDASLALTGALPFLETADDCLPKPSRFLPRALVSGGEWQGKWFGSRPVRRATMPAHGVQSSRSAAFRAKESSSWNFWRVERLGNGRWRLTLRREHELGWAKEWEWSGERTDVRVFLVTDDSGTEVKVDIECEWFGEVDIHGPRIEISLSAEFDVAKASVDVYVSVGEDSEGAPDSLTILLSPAGNRSDSP